MHRDRTVKIAISSHEVVHVRVLFLEVLQITSRNTQGIGLILLIPGRSHFTREVSRYLARMAEEARVEGGSKSTRLRKSFPF